MTFREQLYITLIDKMLIGGMIAVVGLGASMFLEKYKSEQTVEAEFAKVRVNKIGEVQTAINNLESISIKAQHVELEQVLAFGRKLQEEAIKKGLPPDTYFKDLRPKEDKEPKSNTQDAITGSKASEKEIRNELAAIKGTAENIIEQNRFWLGGFLYKQYKQYYENVFKLYESIVITPASKERIEEIKKEVEASRLDVEKVIKLIQ